MKAKREITDYTKRLNEIVKDPKFIKLASEKAEMLGITARQWNRERMAILIMFANEIIMREA